MPNDLFGSAALSYEMLGPDRMLIRDVISTRSFLLSRREASVLQRCTAFRTISGHLETLSQNPAISSHEVHQLLLRFLEQHLLETPEQLLIKRTASVVHESPKPISHVVVSTCDRPSQLLACLASIAGSAELLGFPLLLLVADDSRSEASISQNITSVKAFRSRTGISVTHITRQHRFSLCARLEAMLPSRLNTRRVIGAMPSRLSSESLNRNLALLYCAGSRAIFIDDDVRTTTYDACGSESLIVSSTWNASQTLFYADIDAALSNQDWATDTFFEGHNLYLGKKLSSLITTDAIGEYDNCDPALWRTVLCGQGVVKVTQMGLVGDSGNSLHGWIFNAIQQNNLGARFDGAEYAIARVTRAIRRVTSNYVLTNSQFLMTYAVGIDCSELLPPFMGFARNADRVFASILRFVHPDSCTVHIPQAVAHLGSHKSPLSSTSAYESYEVIKDSELFTSLLGHAFMSRLDPPESCYMNLYTLLRTYGALSAGLFEELVRAECHGLLSKRLRYVEALAGTATFPAAMRADLGFAKDRLTAVLTSGSILLSIQSQPCKLTRALAEVFQRSLLDHARTMSTWIKLWPYARAAQELVTS